MNPLLTLPNSTDLKEFSRNEKIELLNKLN